MQSIEVGLDFTRSARAYELALITRHTTRGDLEAYHIDPVHVEVAKFIKEHSSGAASVDFEDE